MGLVTMKQVSKSRPFLGVLPKELTKSLEYYQRVFIAGPDSGPFVSSMTLHLIVVCKSEIQRPGQE